MKKLSENELRIKQLDREIKQLDRQIKKDEIKSKKRHERFEKWQQRTDLYYATSDRNKAMRERKQKRNDEIYDLVINKNAKILRLSKKYELSPKTIKTIIRKEMAKRGYNQAHEEYYSLLDKRIKLAPERRALRKVVNIRKNDETTERSEADSNREYELLLLDTEYDNAGYEMDKKKKELCEIGFKFMNKQEAMDNYYRYCKQDIKKSTRKPRAKQYKGKRSKYGKTQKKEEE